MDKFPNVAMVYDDSFSSSRILSSFASQSLGLIIFMLCNINPLIITSFAELQRFEHSPKEDGSLSLLVIGDWGRNGLYNQSNVAFQVF